VDVVRVDTTQQGKGAAACRHWRCSGVAVILQEIGLGGIRAGGDIGPPYKH
jgi:hypothetical protein